MVIYASYFDSNETFGLTGSYTAGMALLPN